MIHKCAQRLGWRIVVIFLPSVYVSHALVGQATSTTTKASVVVPSTSVAVVPFTLWQGLILVPATIDGRHGTFILDVGAPLIMLNSQYLRSRAKGGPFPVLDTVRTASSDPAAGARQPIVITVHTLRIGTITVALAPTDIGPPMPMAPSNAAIMTDERFTQMNQPTLGLLGLDALAPFETIIDYPRQQVVFIRLDGAGHRRARVPAYTPVAQVPLVPIASPGTPDQQYWWGVMGNLGGTDSTARDTLQLDTGDPSSVIVARTQARIASHLTPDTSNTDGSATPATMILDRVTVGGHAVTNLPVSIDVSDCDILGYSYLSRLGVVGFNFRTRQFLRY